MVAYLYEFCSLKRRCSTSLCLGHVFLWDFGEFVSLVARWLDTQNQTATLCFWQLPWKNMRPNLPSADTFLKKTKMDPENIVFQKDSPLPGFHVDGRNPPLPGM